MGTRCEIALRWMPHNTLMTRGQHRFRYNGNMPLFNNGNVDPDICQGVNRPQWVNKFRVWFTSRPTQKWPALETSFPNTFSSKPFMCWFNIPWDSVGNKSILVQLKAWCRRATSQCPNQLWPSSLRHMTSLGHGELNIKSYLSGEITFLVLEIISIGSQPTWSWHQIRQPHIREYEAGESGANFTSVGYRWW